MHTEEGLSLTVPLPFKLYLKDRSKGSDACFRPVSLTIGVTYNKGRQFSSVIGYVERQETGFMTE